MIMAVVRYIVVCLQFISHTRALYHRAIDTLVISIALWRALYPLV
jgi:hypothetical protein